MNSLSNIDLNIDYYQQHFKNDVVDKANKQWMVDHYKIGDQKRYKEILHTVIFDDIINKNSCFILEELNKRMSSALTNKKSNYKLEQKIKDFANKKNCTETEACNNIMMDTWT